MISDAYFAQFEAGKYRDRSRAQRALVRRFAEQLHAMVVEAGPLARVLEVGLGEGFVSGFLSERLPGVRFSGVEVDASAAARARRLFPRLDVREGSIYDLAALPRDYDVVLCIEVLEHLSEPARALREVARLGPRRVVVSVPHEPFFRLGNLARLRNVRRLGDDPGHVQHFGLRSLRALLERDLAHVRLARAFPWLLASGVPTRHGGAA